MKKAQVLVISLFLIGMLISGCSHTSNDSNGGYSQDNAGLLTTVEKEESAQNSQSTDEKSLGNTSSASHVIGKKTRVDSTTKADISEVNGTLLSSKIFQRPPNTSTASSINSTSTAETNTSSTTGTTRAENIYSSKPDGFADGIF